MRSGYLGQLTSGIQTVLPPMASSTTGVGEENAPPEKRIALDAIPSRVFAGASYVYMCIQISNVNVYGSVCIIMCVSLHKL